MIHDQQGWWLHDAGLASLRMCGRLSGREDADVVIVGGGYTGMWTALLLSDRIAADQIVLIDREVCGTGPSGRNGGFCHGLADETEQLERVFGAAAARACIERSISDAESIGDWAASAGVDIEFRKAGEMIVSCEPAHDRACDAMRESALRVGLAGEFAPLTADQVRARCSSPLFRNGTFASSVATVHPGRLALGLRDELLRRGVRVFEGTQVTRLEASAAGVRVRSRDGGVTARAGVLAGGAASAGFSGTRREMTLTSSHMVITEPVPEVLEEIGWTNGEAIVDSRRLVHYMRTTADGRIAFGWGGGSIGWGSDPSGRESVSRRIVGKVMSDLRRFFPQLEGRKLEHAWGGPIDASPRHMPAVRPIGSGAWHACFGFTGNGVGPSRVCAGLLADLALDRFADPGDLAPLLLNAPRKVPPEPFRHLGGSSIMRGIDSIERAHERGRGVSAVAAFVSGVPDRLGYRIGR